MVSAYTAATSACDRCRTSRKLLARSQPGNIARLVCRRHRLLECRDADHEELVEVRGGNGRELQPFEQRRVRLRGLFEHTLIEGEPGQLAVDEHGCHRPGVAACHRSPAVMTSWRPKVATKRSDREVAARRSMVLSPDVSSSISHVVSRSTRRRPRTFCTCSASSALAMRRMAASLSTVRRSSRSSATYGRWVVCGRRRRWYRAMFATNGGLVVGEPEDLRGCQDVVRMLVVCTQAHVDPDVVQQGRDLQQQPMTVEQAVLLLELVEQPDGELRDVAAVLEIEAVALAEGLCTGEHLPLEVLGALPAARIGEVQQHAGAQRRIADHELARASFRRPACDRSAAPARGSPPPRAAAGNGRRARPPRAARPRRRTTGTDRARSRADRRRRRCRAICDAANRMSPPTPITWVIRLSGISTADLVDDVRDVATQQRHLDIVAVALQVELLTDPDRAECIDAGLRRFPAFEQRQAGAPSADLREECAGAPEGRMALEHVPDGQEQQAALFCFVDDLKDNARYDAGCDRGRCRRSALRAPRWSRRRRPDPRRTCPSICGSPRGR